MTLTDYATERTQERGYANKLKGYNFELEQFKKERKSSLLAIHSAASKSPADIIAVKKDKILLISCKLNSYLTPTEQAEINKVKKLMPKNCEFQIRYKIGKRTYTQVA